MELLPNEEVHGSVISVEGLTKEELEEWKKTRLPLLQKEVIKSLKQRHIPPTSGDNTED